MEPQNTEYNMTYNMMYNAVYNAEHDVCYNMFANQGPAVTCNEIHGDLNNNTTIYTFDQNKDLIFFEIRRVETNSIGRVSELETLQSFFREELSEPIIKTPAARVHLVTGMGGIGKTQLVSRFVEESRSTYKNVIWIDSENMKSISDSVKRLAKDWLKIPTLDANGAAKDVSSVIEQVLNKLDQRSTLLIFDNVETIENIKFVFTRMSSTGKELHVIITSRQQYWGSGINVIVLQPWSFGEAVEYVSAILNDLLDTQNDIELLVERMQCFPLALRQAAAHIMYQRLSISFRISDYLRIFENEYGTQILLDSEIFRESLTNVYQLTTFTTWSTTIETIQEDETDDQLTARILNIVAYFHPVGLQADFFVHLISCEEQYKQIDQMELVENAIHRLINCSMIMTDDQDEGRRRLSIHKLHQQVIKCKLRQKNRLKFVLKDALKLISKLSKNVQATAEMVAHAISVFQAAKTYPDLVYEFINLPEIVLMVLTDNKNNPTDENTSFSEHQNAITVLSALATQYRSMQFRGFVYVYKAPAILFCGFVLLALTLTLCSRVFNEYMFIGRVNFHYCS